jgi:Arc/MetJ family transcription regulator
MQRGEVWWLEPNDIVWSMSKTSVEIDRDIARQAAEILGTVTLRDTIDASMREIVQAKRRLELIEMFSDPERFNVAIVEHAWGDDQ